MEKFKKITDKDISSRGVQALADKPNAAARYGVGGLSPADLKEWFDKLASFLARHINDITDILGSDKAAQYICIALGELGIGDLAALIKSFEDGTFANKVLKLAPPGATTDHETLQDVINELDKAISEHREETKNDADALDAAFTDGSISDKLKTGFSEGDITYTLRQALMALNTGKLDKAEKAGYAPDSHDSAAYTVGFNGGQELMRISVSEAGAIVKRDSNGALWVPHESILYDGHAVNKKYTDDNFAHSFYFWLDETNYQIHLVMYNAKGIPIDSETIDLPLESVVMGATYGEGKLTLKLTNGNAVDVDVSAIVSGLVPNSRTINNQPLTKDITLGASDVGAVPTTRTINGKPLTSDITLGASNVGAYTKKEVDDIAAGKLDAHSGYGDYTYVYGVGNTGNQLMQVIRVGATPNSLAHRDEKGRLSGTTPASANHLTNKKYVDEKNTALGGRLTAAEEELATLAASGGGQPTVLLTDVEDTFTERETAGGLNVADGTVTEVKKITGATVAVCTLLEGGNIYADQNEIQLTAEAAAAAGYPIPDSDGLTGYFLSNFSFIVYGEEDCYSIPEGFYFCVRNAGFGDFGDGDTICRVGVAWQLVTSELKQLKHAFFQGIECTSADGKKQSELSLAEPVELGRWDVLDVEKGQIERYTRAMGVMDLPLAYSAVDDGSYKCFCFMYDADKVPLHANESAFDIVSTYYEARSLSANDHSICVQSGAGGRPLFQIRDDSCLVFADPDGYEFDADASKQKFIDHLTDIGLVLEYRTAEAYTTEAVDCPTGYVAYNGGTERVVQGDVDNSAHGAECTVTQTYYVSYGGDT